MSAARWRNALRTPGSAAQGGAATVVPNAWNRGAAARALDLQTARTTARDKSGRRTDDGAQRVGARMRSMSGAAASTGAIATRRFGVRHAVVLLALAVYPFVATPFFTFQIAAQAFVLGLVALSLAFLAGYGGMVSLAQMTVAGIAAYFVAILGMSHETGISLGWPWWAAVPLAVAIGTLAATAIGWMAVRTEGIYTIMITLAIGVAFFYLVQQNYSMFNGFQGFARVVPPQPFGVDLRAPVPFYFLSLAAALAAYAAVQYLVRAPFGIALQGIRDNARRMRSLGFHVTAHRIAAWAFAGLLASVGGVLLVWYNGQISPGVVQTGSLINVLIVAVLGGMRHPIGAFIGAIVFVLLQNFAIDLVDRERFNLVIGGAFLLIVLFSPDGLLGLWQRARRAFAHAKDRRDSTGATRSKS